MTKLENSADWHLPVGPLRFRRGIRVDCVELVEAVEGARLQQRPSGFRKKNFTTKLHWIVIACECEIGLAAGG